MPTCSKAFTLTVAPGFWGDLVWDAPTVSPGTPPGTSSAVLEGGSFETAIEQQGPRTLNEVLECNGSLTYTGPEVNCNLHLVVSNVNEEQSVQILIQVDGNPVLDKGDPDGLAMNGTYDFPFTIPISVGAVVTVYLLTVVGSNNAVLAQLEWAGLLTP